MKLSAVVVWYNPKELSEGGATRNILSYSSFVEVVYIIDNSAEDNSELAKEISNSVYVPLGKNTGIAHALNEGLKKSFENDFQYSLIMDQDSSFEKRELEKYLSVVEGVLKEKEAGKYENVKSFSPLYYFQDKNYYTLKKIRKFIYNHTRHTVFRLLVRTKTFHNFIIKKLRNAAKMQTTYLKKATEEASHLWISSGNILELDTWDRLGRFFEPLFIDEVDSDYCARLFLNNLVNYPVTGIHFNHKIGNGRKTFFNHSAIIFHNSSRAYYLLRNNLYMIKKYPAFTRLYDYEKKIKSVIKDLIFFSNPLHLKKNLEVIHRAKKDLETLLNS